MAVEIEVSPFAAVIRCNAEPTDVALVAALDFLTAASYQHTHTHAFESFTSSTQRWWLTFQRPDGGAVPAIPGPVAALCTVTTRDFKDAPTTTAEETPSA